VVFVDNRRVIVGEEGFVAFAAGSPEEWMPENVGALLYLCGDEITVKVLMSKAINGRVLELAGVVVSLCVVCARQAEPASWAVSVLRRVLAAMDNARDRLALLHAVLDTFRDNLADLHDFAATAAAAANDHSSSLPHYLSIPINFIFCACMYECMNCVCVIQLLK